MSHRVAVRPPAGRANRHRSTPRNPDGTFEATATRTIVQQAGMSHADSAAIAAAQFGPSLQLLMPRASLAPARTFLRSAVHDPAPLSSAPPAAAAPAFVPAAPSVPLSSFGASSLRRDGQQAFDAWSAAQSDASAPTPLGPAVFFPAALTNFGEGAGVAGTRGQRWVPKKGVTDFLCKIAHTHTDAAAADDAASAQLPHHMLSPAEQHSASLVSPRHAYQKRELAFSNIRPETPSSKSLDAAGGRRAVRPVLKAPAPKTAAELREAQMHAADLAAVRAALRKLGAAAGDLNRREWFRGVDFDGHAPLSAAVLFDSILPQLGVTNLGGSAEMTSNPRAVMLKALLFGDAATVEFQTLIPRLQPVGSANSTSVGRSEPDQYLSYWSHLPAPPPKLNPCPTALSALRTLKERMDTRGLGPFLHGLGLLGTRHGDSTEVTTPAQLQSALTRLHLDLPPVEFRKLVSALDPDGTGSIPYAELFKLSEQPAHWMHRGHAKHRELAMRVDAAVGMKGRGDESSRRKSATDAASIVAQPAIAAVARPSTCSAASSSGSVPPLSFSLDLMPPLFQSVHTACSAHRSATAAAAELSASAAAAVAGSQSAREYSRYAPHAAPLRSERTPHVRHTPLDSMGSFGRPVEGSVVRPVSARSRQALEAQRRLPSVSAAAGGASVVSDSRGRALSSLYADEHDRFTPRADAIRQMQLDDKQRKVARVAAYGARLDSHEQRVLCAYERDALTQQRQAANSILDKVQQKVAYMRSLQGGAVMHGEGKRVHDKFAEECKQQEQQQQQAQHDSAPVPIAVAVAVPAAASS